MLLLARDSVSGLVVGNNNSSSMPLENEFFFLVFVSVAAIAVMMAYSDFALALVLIAYYFTVVLTTIWLIHYSIKIKNEK